MNNVNLIGRITKDLELKMSQAGKEVLSFSIAWNDRSKKGHFFNCVSFGKTAEIINQYFKKGDLIGVTGTLNQNVWTDKDGNKRYDVNVVVNEFSFCNSGSGKTEETFSNDAPIPENNPFSDDKIPF